jgi:hypothetical protein
LSGSDEPMLSAEHLSLKHLSLEQLSLEQLSLKQRQGFIVGPPHGAAAVRAAGGQG